METLFDLLERESESAVRAVLGHWLIGYVHPYPDGNGRMARFLMNAMFASGGFPWAVVRVEDRSTYLAGLEQASVHMNVKPFAEFIAERTSWSTNGEVLELSEPLHAPDIHFGRGGTRSSPTRLR